MGFQIGKQAAKTERKPAALTITAELHAARKARGRRESGEGGRGKEEDLCIQDP